VGAFLRQLSWRFHRETSTLEASKLLLMQNHEWRGNIRELENWISRHVLLGEDELLQELVVAKHQYSGKPYELSDGGIPLKRIARQAGRGVSREWSLVDLQADRRSLVRITRG